jgi:CheY-like chemotaxis protein
LIETPEGNQTAPESGAQDVVYPDCHVLLVDDNAVNQKVAQRQLARYGLRVTQAWSGQEALRLLQQHPYDLVFMDCQMPQMDGYETTRQIRSAESGVLRRDVPIVALTAHVRAGEEARECSAT